MHSAAYFFVRLWLYLALPLPPPSYLTTHVNRHTPQVALSLYFTLPPKFRACALMFLGAIIGASTCGRSTVVDLYAVCSVAPCKHAEIEARSARRSPLPHPPRPGFGSRALGRARYGRLDSVARARSQRLSNGFSCYDLEVVRGEGQPARVSHPRRLTGELGAGVEIGHALRR